MQALSHPFHSLALALTQAEQQRDAAQAQVLQARQAFETAQQQALQLDAYRDEYQRRWSGQAGQPRDAGTLWCYQSFLERLHQAIAQQQQALGTLTSRLEVLARSLQAHELRAAAIRKLIERRQQALRQAEARRDQKRSDEQAARMAWSARLGGPEALVG
ncbi:flagellar export protein FliJ [Ramlibacter sp. 2FC]|uniref:flagellar export protein FliJ n=1 Tax=Ramlibacter sp. 2FC TaxID=2502188 RepID=UPI0010F96B3E|nr:flagellar export protein FliJ [Ramlibacter sp. 2FC]